MRGVKSNTSLSIDKDLYDEFKAVASLKHIKVGLFLEQAMREMLDRSGYRIRMGEGQAEVARKG